MLTTTTTTMMMMLMLCLKMILVLLTLTCGLVMGAQQIFVSENCACYGTDLVDCRRRQLTSVPKFHATNVSFDKLLLSNNRIQHIGASAFRGIRFRKLEIFNNPLRSVDAAAFAHLETTLTEVELDLDRSGAEFPDVALSTLVNLTRLAVNDFAKSHLPPSALRALHALRELRLTRGQLDTLTANDVAAQQSTLQVLDISDNKLREFPTDAVRMLRGLKVFNIRANLIDHLSGHAVISRSLQQLDISHHALDRAGINETAFDGVAPSLQRLVMSQCHLADRHSAAITRATGVSELVVAFNRFTSVKSFISEMPNLRLLDAQNNSVDVLTTVTLPSSRLLRSLNLAYNPLTRVDPTAFVQLTSLEDLKLDFARAAMPLGARSFISQRATLRNLSLRGVDLSRPKWTIIHGLRRLEMLSLSNCRLGNIPPFTFRHSGGAIHTLELANNDIDQLGQRSVVGLESSLVRLNLDGNRLTTIDRCTFHEFTRLSPKSLILRNNLLRCDCGMLWFYRWTNDSRFPLYWLCSDGRPFGHLTDDDFTRCNDSHNATAECELFTVATTTAGARQRMIGLFLVNVTVNSFAVRWTFNSADLPPDALAFFLNCTCFRSPASSLLTLELGVRQHLFVDLAAGTSHRVCVMIDSNWTSAGDGAVSCLDVTTTSSVSYGSTVRSLVVVGIVLLCVLSVSLVICVMVRRWRRRRRIRLAELAHPKIAAGKTKRFMRSHAHHLPQSVDTSASDRLDSVDMQLDAMRVHSRSVETHLDLLHDDDDDRYKTLLALTLLQSRNARSLDNLNAAAATASANQGAPAGPPRCFLNQLYGLRDSQRHFDEEQEVYDEINDDEVDCTSPLATDLST